MGFYFRKSKKFGPFRLNFSKSGIGASVGVKAARVSTAQLWDHACHIDHLSRLAERFVARCRN